MATFDGFQKIYQTIYRTPANFDDLLLTSDKEALIGLNFITTAPKITTTTDELPIFTTTHHWLNLYFSGQNPNFIPHYHIQNATPFRLAVLEIIKQIPFGQTLTYGEIATQIARQRHLSKMSAQAVGNAVGWNPICLIIPCHRVIGAAHNLTGYGGGLNNKIALLKLEHHELSKFHSPKSQTSQYIHNRV